MLETLTFGAIFREAAMWVEFTLRLYLELRSGAIELIWNALPWPLQILLIAYLGRSIWPVLSRLFRRWSRPRAY
jgi:hypothetical protein